MSMNVWIKMETVPITVSIRKVVIIVSVLLDTIFSLMNMSVKVNGVANSILLYYHNQSIESQN